MFPKGVFQSALTSVTVSNRRQLRRKQQIHSSTLIFSCDVRAFGYSVYLCTFTFCRKRIKIHDLSLMEIVTRRANIYVLNKKNSTNVRNLFYVWFSNLQKKSEQSMGNTNLALGAERKRRNQCENSQLVRSR